MDTGSPASDLERFRKQWQEEVNSRSKQTVSSGVRPESSRINQRSDRTRPERPVNKPSSRHPASHLIEDETQQPEALNQADISQRIENISVKDIDDDEFSPKTFRKEPQSALEHYERAVEKENQGSLGDSLSHYRKAYRLDAEVDKSYKKKHFAHKWKSTSDNASNAVATTASTPDQLKSDQPAIQLTFEELIASFANSEIPNAEPIIEGDIPPPCPIRKLPTEVLLEFLQHIALDDVSVFARLALVCKKLAYHVFSENSIWKRIALGPEFGLASQCYHFGVDVHGREAIYQALEDDDEDEAPLPPVTDKLFPADPDWREVFHSYPRIRFSGVYISTVNYTRSGGVSVTPGTWNSQVHIVTYYRYLRFFRDGTVISLLTTHEPIEVVHHLTKENVSLVRGGKDAAHPLNFTASAGALLPPPRPDQILPPTAQNIMKHALRGRWRLCHPSLEGIEIGSNNGVAGDLHIETEGAGPRYMYTMHLVLKHGSRNKTATKNNKLQWKGFWSYNQLTNDWAEFTLRNDKAFYFSRVKRYGVGH